MWRRLHYIALSNRHRIYMKTVIFQKTVIERIRSGEGAEITLGNLEKGKRRKIY